MSGATCGFIGKRIYNKSYVYINAGLYSSFIINCHGYSSGAIIDDKYSISNYTNYVKRTSAGNTSFNLYKNEYCYCLEIPSNADVFISLTFYFGPLIVENTLRDGYSLCSYM